MNLNATRHSAFPHRLIQLGVCPARASVADGVSADGSVIVGSSFGSHPSVPMDQQPE
jgi:uncharacterized membrane protein